MNGKHTKGKWRVVTYDDGTIYVQAKYNICFMLYTGHPREIEANARLIAAAPELLEACLDALDVYSHKPGDETPLEATLHAKLHAAIEAAEGRG